MSPSVAGKTKLRVSVLFPLGSGKPYKAEEGAETTVGDVLEAAIEHFGVSADSGSRYFLGFGSDLDEVDEAETLGALDDKQPGKGTLKFTLVKELIQG
jgi:hypothetical protein